MTYLTVERINDYYLDGKNPKLSKYSWSNGRAPVCEIDLNRRVGRVAEVLRAHSRSQESSSESQQHSRHCKCLLSTRLLARHCDKGERLNEWTSTIFLWNVALEIGQVKAYHTFTFTMAKAKTWTVHGAPSQAAMTEHTTAKFTTTTSNNKNEEESQHTLDHQVPSEGIAQEEETVFSSLRYPLISRQQLRRRARIAQEEVMPFGYRSNDEDQDTQGPTDSNGGSAGFPLEYSCRRQVTGIPTSTLFVIYDYEYVADSATEDFAASDTSTTPTTLPAVEWGTLWRVADQMGLHECSFTKQQIPTNNRKLAVDENSTNIVTLSSAPVDNFDPLVGTFCESARLRMSLRMLACNSHLSLFVFLLDSWKMPVP